MKLVLPGMMNNRRKVFHGSWASGWGLPIDLSGRVAEGLGRHSSCCFGFFPLTRNAPRVFLVNVRDSPISCIQPSSKLREAGPVSTVQCTWAFPPLPAPQRAMHTAGAPWGLLSQREGQARRTVCNGPLLPPGQAWSGERREGDQGCLCVCVRVCVCVCVQQRQREGGGT